MTPAAPDRPVPLDAGVSARLSRMPVKNSGPETALRRQLHRRGLRYTLHPRGLPGRPDIWFSRAGLAVFVDGCFWHACPQHGTLPRNNRDWWREKLERTRQRDHAKDAALVAAGYTVLHVWEHEDPSAAAESIHILWQQLTARPRVETDPAAP